MLGICMLGIIAAYPVFLATGGATGEEGSILFKIREFCLFIYYLFCGESSPPVYLNT